MKKPITRWLPPGRHLSLCLLFSSALLLCLYQGAQAQTTIISPSGDGGFESGADFAANGWTVQNYTSTNTSKWFTGAVAPPSAGSGCAYISNDAAGATYNYATGSSSRVMFWRDVTFPAGETAITLSFKIKVNGEDTYDDLSVFIQNGSTVPAVTQPSSSSSSSPSISNTTRLATLSLTGSSYVTRSYTISAATAGNASAASTRRLIFYWENDGTSGTQPPASIDEISLVSAAGPSNDNATSATGLTVNADLACGTVTSGSTLGSSQSADAAPGCSATGIDDDVWYSFVATNGAHRISFSNLSNSNATMVAAVYNGTPGSLSPLANACGSGSVDVTGLSAGTTYYIRAYTTGTANTTGFNICVGTLAPPPSNDNASGAVPLTVNADYNCGTTTAGTTQSASQSPDAAPGCSATGINDDVWFTFVATGTSHRISYSNLSNSSATMAAALYTGTPGSLAAVSGACASTTFDATGLTPGTTYYVRAYTTGTSNITGFNICIGTPPPPPANDNASGAIPLTVNADYNCGITATGTTQSATQSPDATPGCNTTGINDDVWYTFVATGAAHRVSFSNLSNGSATMVAALYTGTPGSLTVVSGACASSTLNATALSAGTTYYVRAYTSGTTNVTNFTICIGTPPPPPVNDELCNAITIVPSTTCSYATYNNFSATGSTGAPDPGCASYSGGDVWFRVTVPVSGHLKLDAQTGTMTDGGMALYTSSDNTCNGTLSLVECDDDDSPNGSMPMLERYDLVPGSTVFVRFWEYGNDNPGSFGVCATYISCIAPASAAANTITSTTANITWTGSGTSYIVEYGPVGFTPGTGDAAGTNGVIASGTVSPVTLSGLTPSIAYEVYVRQNCTASGNGYSTNSSVASFTTQGLPPANDEPAGAVTLSLGTACAATYNNTNATLAANEPRISCKGSLTASAQVWFRFIAPPSGFVRISTDYVSTALDTKLGLFGTSNPSDPADMSSFFIISCDDDGGVSGNTSTIYASGLTGGATYYVAVAHYSNATMGNFCIDVKEVTSAMLSATGNCTSVQSMSSYLNTYNGWISLIDNSGNLVANVKQNAGTATDFSGAFTVSASGRTDANGQPYLNRNYLISGSGATSADLKLYFTDAEVTALGSPLSGLNVSRVSGTSCTANFSGTATVLNQTSSGSANGISWITVTTPGFSNFFIMSGTTPLPVTLIRFDGKNDGIVNHLGWETAMEKNFSHFELERSDDGIRFGKLGNIAAHQRAEGSSYTHTDERPLRSRNLYRLKMFDLDGRSSVSDVIEIQAGSGSGLSLNVFPNPVQQELHIDIIGKSDGKASLQVLDIVGKVLQTLPVNGDHINVAMQHLPQGIYMIRYIDNSHQSVIKVSKH